MDFQKIENIFAMKEKFARLIRFYAQRNHVSQATLANLFGITPSAICQMIDCNILFNLEELSIVAKALKLKEEEHYELQLLLSRIRNGAILHSPFNRLMKKLRKEHKMNISEVSLITKISRARLQEFEENFETNIYLEEAEKLAELYNYKLRDLLKTAEISRHEIIIPEEDGDSLSDNSASYTLPNHIPLFQIDELSKYETAMGFQGFVDAKKINFYNYTSAKNVVALEADNELLDIPFSGKSILIVREYFEEDPTVKLIIGMDKKESYHLFNYDSFKNYNYLISGKYSVKAPKLKWMLTVEELIIKTR